MGLGRRLVSRADELLALPFRGLVAFYRRYISRLLPPACRFEPSCSAYAAEALTRCRGVRGLALTVWRVARCNPWGGHGFDPVPPCGCDRADGLKAARPPLRHRDPS